MISIGSQCSEERTFSFVETLLQSLWYVTASGAIVLFYCHKIVAINNVQQCIKHAKRKKNSFCAFALLPVSHVTHPGHLLLAHGRMEETF